MTALEKEVKAYLTEDVLNKCKRDTILYCSYYNDYEFHAEDKHILNYFLIHTFKQYVIPNIKGIDITVLRKYSDKICREYLGL